MHGTFFWYDVMTTDTAAAQKFYGDVVGWGAEDSGTPGTAYTLFTLEGRGVAGLMDLPDDADGARPAWMGYVAVDDVDDTVARIKAEGGTLHKGPIEIPNTIRFAVVADPQGAVFLVAKGLVVDSAPPPLASGTPGTVGWHELYAKDWESAFAFYAKLFGWTKGDAIDMGPMGTYQLFATGGDAVGGMMNKPAVMPVPFWGFYFNVPRLDERVDRVTTGGGKLMNGPMQVPGGQWIANCSDPQGAMFSLVSFER